MSTRWCVNNYALDASLIEFMAKEPGCPARWGH